MIQEIVALIGFAGFLIGMIIASKTKEELKPGKKYFKIGKKCILILSALFMLNYLQTNPWLIIAGVAIGYFIRKPITYFGAAMGAAAATPLINIIGVFTFIFGMVEGTLEFNKEKKKSILIALALFFGTYVAFRIINMEVLANAAAGAMIVEAFRKK